MLILIIIAIGFFGAYLKDAESYLDYLKPGIVVIILISLYIFLVKPYYKSKEIKKEQVKLAKKVEQNKMVSQAELEISQDIIKYFRANEIDLTKYDKSLAFYSDNSATYSLIYCKHCRFDQEGTIEMNDHGSGIILTNRDLPNYETSTPYDILLRVVSSATKFETVELEVESEDDYGSYNLSYLDVKIPRVIYEANLIRIMPTYDSFVDQGDYETFDYLLDDDKIRDQVINALGSNYLPFFE